MGTIKSYLWPLKQNKNIKTLKVEELLFFCSVEYLMMDFVIQPTFIIYNSKSF